MTTTQLPNLFLIGTHKGGTTSFYEMLAAHPEIHAPEPKEPGYFSLSSTITAENLTDYRSIYDGAEPHHRFVLDGSTSYAQTILYPHTVTRIKEHCGDDVRFIYLLRDPIERMRAAYVQLRSEGNNDLPRDIDRALPRLIEPTLYYNHYRAYADVWGPESVFVATFEELISAPNGLTRRCLSFLGASHEALEPVHANAGSNRSQNSRVLDAAMRIPGAAPLAKRLMASPASSALQGFRSTLSTDVEKPDITPDRLGAEWHYIAEQAEAILDVAQTDRSIWPSLA